MGHLAISYGTVGHLSTRFLVSFGHFSALVALICSCCSDLWLMVTKLRLLQWGENPNLSGKEPPRRIATLKCGRQRKEVLWATWPFPMSL